MVLGAGLPGRAPSTQVPVEFQVLRCETGGSNSCNRGENPLKVYPACAMERREWTLLV